MPDNPKAKVPAATQVDTATRSQILSMIRSHISLASQTLPVADVDAYSKGDSPGPVDQYSKGSPTSFMDQVSDPAELLQRAGNLGANVAKTTEQP